MISCIYSTPFLETSSDLDWESLSHFDSGSNKPTPTGILNFPLFGTPFLAGRASWLHQDFLDPFLFTRTTWDNIWPTRPACLGVIIRPIASVITLGRANLTARPNQNILGPNIAPSLLRSPTVPSWSGLDLEEAKTFIAFLNFTPLMIIIPAYL